MIRNIFLLFRRYTGSMVLTFAGLVLAFCAFLGIMDHVRYEYSYDTSYPDHENIYKVDMKEVEGVFKSVLPPGFVDAIINSSAHIAAGTLYCPFTGEQYIIVEDEFGQKQGFMLEVNNVSAGIFDVFGIEILEGDRNALAEPDKIALPESIARRLFGSSPAVGKRINIPSGSGFFNETDWTVGAVYKDLPENSQISNNIFMPLPDSFLNVFGASNFLCWLRIDGNTSPEAVAEEFNASFDFTGYDWLSPIELVPIKDVHFKEEGSDARIYKSGSRSQCNILIVAAILILLTGIFNYTNFYTALVPSRMRGINTRKVFGAGTGRLRGELFLETLFLCLSACIISMVIMYAGLSLRLDPVVMAVCVGASVVAGLLSGIYPAILATSFQPAMVLNGRYELSGRGRSLKNILLTLQFAVSMCLIIYVSFISLQNRLISHYDTGFDKDRLAVVELTSDLVSMKGELFREEIKKHSELEDVAFAMETLGGQEVYSTMSVEWKGNSFQAFQLYCSDNFLDVMGIKVDEGRGFLKGESNIIFNKAARDEYGLELGSMPLLGGDVVGFCENARFSSLRQDNTPLCFMSMPLMFGFTPIAYIRMAEGADRETAASIITSEVKKLDPALPVEVRFYDQILSDVYATEDRFQTTIMLFAILAACLSLAGIFSMVIFETQFRRKEIALRRVHGAEPADIVKYGNRPYLVLTLISFAIAAPVGWFISSSWLEQFYVRTGFNIWVFVAAVVVVLLLTSAIVSTQYIRAATTNPAEVLKSE